MRVICLRPRDTAGVLVQGWDGASWRPRTTGAGLHGFIKID